MVKTGMLLLQEINKLVNSSDFIGRHRIGEKSFIRTRKLPFAKIFTSILYLVKKSLTIECELMEPDINIIPPSKQAFSKARYKVSHTAFQELLKVTQEVFYQNQTSGLWKGYRMIAADGSSLRLPVSKEIERDGRFKANAKGVMPLVGRVSLFVDLCTAINLNARLSRWDVGELALAEEQLPEVVQQMDSLGQKKLLFLYDRGYISLKYIKLHVQLGVDFLFRLPRNVFKGIWKRVDQGENDFVAKIEQETVRIIAIPLDNGEVEVLLTSLLDFSLWNAAEIGKLYTLRWQIEECYKRLKIPEELENFSGKNLEAVLQEFWAHLVMGNILATHICDIQVPWAPEKIPEYRLNFSVLFGSTKHKLREVIEGKCRPKDFQKLFDRVVGRAKCKVKLGRKFSRAKMAIPKRHHVFRRVC